MDTLTFDPKMLITPPYWSCPRCNSQDGFGVLMVCGHHYVRRCKNCCYDKSYKLPALNKKVIYLDQFAVSEMMKALNPGTDAHKKGRTGPFWVELFNRLDTLSKLHLIVCPSSPVHTDESLLASYFEDLKRMYEFFSHGVRFEDPSTATCFQICEHAEEWIRGCNKTNFDFNLKSIVHGDINAWQDKLSITMRVPRRTEWVKDLRQARQRGCDGLAEVFGRWQTEKKRTFEDWFEEEAMSFGRVQIRMYFAYLQSFMAAACDGRVPVESLLPTSAVVLFTSIQEVFREADVEESQLLAKTEEYLCSPALKDVPSIRISAMLYAALARKAASGQRRPPSPGTRNDVRFVSAYLPYSDAMFIDREFAGLLKEAPLCTALDYGTLVFSPATKSEFMAYLNGIEASASAEHVKKVVEVYGRDWLRPYTTLYQDEDAGA